jgi:hypothetical protein
MWKFPLFFLRRQYPNTNNGTVNVPSTPIKEQEATLLMKILPLDICYLLGCGLQWDPEDTSASGGPAQSSQSARAAAPAPAPSDDAATTDRSRSASPPADPHDFIK